MKKTLALHVRTTTQPSNHSQVGTPVIETTIAPPVKMPSIKICAAVSISSLIKTEARRRDPRQ